METLQNATIIQKEFIGTQRDTSVFQNLGVQCGLHTLSEKFYDFVAFIKKYFIQIFIKCLIAYEIDLSKNHIINAFTLKFFFSYPLCTVKWPKLFRNGRNLANLIYERNLSFDYEEQMIVKLALWKLFYQKHVYHLNSLNLGNFDLHDTYYKRIYVKGWIAYNQKWIMRWLLDNLYCHLVFFRDLPFDFRFRFTIKFAIYSTTRIKIGSNESTFLLQCKYTTFSCL